MRGRQYHRAQDLDDGSWLLLVSDMDQDTLNGELLLLPASAINASLELAPNQTLGSGAAAAPWPPAKPLGSISTEINATVRSPGQ